MLPEAYLPASSDMDGDYAPSGRVSCLICDALLDTDVPHSLTLTVPKGVALSSPG